MGTVGKYGGEDAKYNTTPTTPVRTPTKPATTKPKYNPAAEGNGQAAFNSNPYLNEVVAAGQAAGNTGSGLDAFVRAASPYITGNTSPTPQGPAPLMPTSPGGGSRGGGGGGGSSAAAQQAAAAAAIKSLFQMYNRPADQTLTSQLATITQQAQGTGAQALANLRQMLGTYGNPYLQAKQLPGGVGATDAAPNPNQQRQDGAPGIAPPSSVPAGSDAAQAASPWQQIMAQSYQAMTQDRMNDVNMSEASFAQQVANNQAAYQYQIAQQEKARKDEMMMSILNMAVQNGLNLADLGVTF